MPIISHRFTRRQDEVGKRNIKTQDSPLDMIEAHLIHLIHPERKNGKEIIKKVSE